MKKILTIAEREFLATAGTKAFIIGTLVSPLFMAIMIVVFPRMIQKGPPKIDGVVAVVDASGRVAGGLRAFLEPERIAQRRQDDVRRLEESMPQALRAATGSRPSKEARDAAFLNALGEVPTLGVETLAPGADLEIAKAPLKETLPSGQVPAGRIALVVLHGDAVVRAPGKTTFGTYDLFVRGKLDDRIVEEINKGLRQAIVEARASESGLDPAMVETLTKVDRVQSRTVTAGGEDATSRVLNQLMPAAFMGLILLSVLMSGQYLLTTIVEEKASRVVEVLLSAVSPMELMAGKILGQFAVGLLVLLLYMGLGVIALISFAALGLLDPVLIVFLLAFFLLAYLSVGTLMAAVGSAVNDIREAQGLMTPIMIVIAIPWLLWLPISRDPNSLFATVLSFVPPISSFVMMLRLASTSPPPLWQPILAIVTGALGCWATVWFAAKVFRIGLLMYGKPPDFRTLVRWVRMG